MNDATRGSDEATDRELIGRWRRGDQRAATELVERHAPALARFVAATDRRADVQDTVQDTFVRAFGAIDSFRAESSFRTWLFTIARRLLLDQRRAAARGWDAVELQETDAATPYNALDALVAGETRQQLRELLDGLTPTQREVFVLRVAEGMSYKEIADAVGTTEGAARVHYYNALRAVRELLDA